VLELNGTVRFKRADATQLKVTALDFNGYPAGSAATAQEIRLRPTTIYHLIVKQRSQFAITGAAPSSAGHRKAAAARPAHRRSYSGPETDTRTGVCR
jgi:hypothetical protein